MSIVYAVAVYVFFLGTFAYAVAFIGNLGVDELHRKLSTLRALIGTRR